MIGRKKEIDELNTLYQSQKAELVAVYGRPRVGKTYLVDQVFKGKFAFRHAGLSPVEMKDMAGTSPLRKQLKHFYNSLLMQGMKKSRCPADWLDAFLLLEQFLENRDTGERMLVFLDELPWLDTQRSGFITAFEGFWNNWGCHRDNLMVIVCGSATTWILDSLINNQGGLYDRVTYEIKLSPFNLSECEQFFKSEKIKLSRYDIVCAYMAVGGIPYYLQYFKRGLSLPQNVDRLFFSKDAKLKNEYSRLFGSIFNRPEMMKAIVETLSERKLGFTRNEISEKTGFTVGGTLTDALNALVASDFVIKYHPFGLSKKEWYYKLVDPFCLFHIKFAASGDALNGSFWTQNNTSPRITVWRGFAFENVCFNHIEQIKSALGISGISTTQSAWSSRGGDEEGTQIDLIIDRADNVVNMCELKFYSNDFNVENKYYRILLSRQELLGGMISPKKVIHQTLVTTYGLQYSEYSGIFDHVIIMDDLFR